MNTLVVGASTNPSRYANIATNRLLENGHSVILFGLKNGEIFSIPIYTEWDKTWLIDTVTLYIGPQNQPEYIDRIIALKPRRVIFNPGTENDNFINLLQENGIETEIACTLVLLATGSY